MLEPFEPGRTGRLVPIVHDPLIGFASVRLAGLPAHAPTRTQHLCPTTPNNKPTTRLLGAVVPHGALWSRGVLPGYGGSSTSNPADVELARNRRNRPSRTRNHAPLGVHHPPLHHHHRRTEAGWVLYPACTPVQARQASDYGSDCNSLNTGSARFVPLRRRPPGAAKASLCPTEVPQVRKSLTASVPCEPGTSDGSRPGEPLPGDSARLARSPPGRCDRGPRYC